MKLVIIGNGVAGVNLAAQIRKQEAQAEAQAPCQIDIYTEEAFDLYSRIRLPEVFGSGLDCQDLSMYPMSWYQSRSIAVHKDRKVASIDREAKAIRLANGEQVAYDALALATGASCLRPEVKGVGLGGVRTLRDYHDADWIRAWIQEGARSFCVVGGGLLGLEAAWHIKRAGVARVVVVEMMERLLPRQLDGEGADILRKTLEGDGLEFRLGARLDEFIGDSVVRGIGLKGGETIDCDAALLSMGIKPRIDLALSAGLKTARGVVVDQCLRSSDPAIYALGDAAEFDGVVWGIVPVALEEAACAAAAILGRELPRYRQSTPQNILKVGGIDLFSIGGATGAAQDGKNPVKERISDGKGSYACLTLRDGILEGAILIGHKEKRAQVIASMGKPCSLGQLGLA